MDFFNLFSKEQKKLRGVIPDVFKYKELPSALRVQIVHTLKGTFGDDHYSSDLETACQHIRNVLTMEYGVF